MRTLSDTMARLAAAQLRNAQTPATGHDRLTDLTGFGSNPGQLRAHLYVPADLPRRAPLVVVLHGCTQNAAGYDHGSGWSTLADRHGFALLYPEQQRANNGNLCFNWFVPDHIGRNGGEPLSIRQMIARMIADHDLDPARVFVTGLSAGGAMTAAMLATWPELFAGGAIIAGLPYAAATSMTEAFDRMRGHGMPSAGTLGEKVRSASPHQGPWPRLSIWHGTADQTVALSNMEAIAGQWRAVHGLPDAPSRTDAIDGARRAQWCDARGRAVLETITIDGMGHGTPIAPSAADGVGAVMPHMLDAGISSTRRIAEFWGIAATSEQASLDQGMAGRQALPGIVLPLRRAPDKHAAAVSGVTRVIEDALRAAGLLR